MSAQEIESEKVMIENSVLVNIKTFNTEKITVDI